MTLTASVNVPWQKKKIMTKIRVWDKSPETLSGIYVLLVLKVGTKILT